MLRFVRLRLAASLAVLAACGGGEPEMDPPRPEDCAARPFGEGCPCLPGATARCYGGDETTAGVGACVTGRTECVDRRWGPCVGEVAPRGETCDGQDDDCDGLVDEGVRSPCGACTPGCDGAVWGEADDPFVPDEGEGVALGPLDALTLARETTLDATAVWVANSADGTVSKIDALAAVEVARYATGGSEPSRVAVDYHGDAWIANRELDGGISSVLKIAGATDRCVDRDGDGLETSTGPSDVRAFGEDECVLFTVPVGGPGEVARALAIDGDRGLDFASGGNAWIGLHDGEAVVVLEGITGIEQARIETPGFQPYAAAFDPWGTLWLASRDGYLARIDRGADPLAAEILEVPLACFLLYSLAVDRMGKLVLTGFSCDDVVLYDPALGVHRALGVPPSPRGVTIVDGTAWVAHTGGALSAIALDPLAVTATHSLSSDAIAPLESIGVGADGAGNVWVASSQGAPGGLGVATRFDASSGEVTAQVVVGRAPHTQGDLSGAELTGGFVAEGSLSHVFDGCPLEGMTEWRRLHVELSTGPAGSVAVALRHAADRASLATVPFTEVGMLPPDTAPLSLSAPDGGVIEVRLTLGTRARDSAPLVRRVGVEWACPGPG